MQLPSLLNSLVFLCITGGVAAAVYAMLLTHEAFSKLEEGSEIQKKTKKKAYTFMVIAALFTAGKLLATHYLK